MNSCTTVRVCQISTSWACYDPCSDFTVHALSATHRRPTFTMHCTGQATAYPMTPGPQPGPTPPSFSDCKFTAGQDFRSKTSNDTGHSVFAATQEV